jgi:tetratricopeptide (TPR) repeat protein
MRKPAFSRGDNRGPPPLSRTPHASNMIDTSGQPRSDARPPSSGMPSSIWQSLLVWLSSLEGPRKLVINGLVAVVPVLGAIVVGKAAWQEVYVIEPISVPKDLEAQGHTPVSVGQRIIDAVTEINRIAAMTKQIGIYTLSEADPLDRDATDFQTPGRTHLESSFALSSNDTSRKYDVSVGGVSLTTIILYVRELFGWSDTKISGEIIVDRRPSIGIAGKDEKPAPTKFSIRLRITDKEVIQREGDATEELDTLFERAALKVVERFDPLKAAYYSYYKQDYDTALRIARAYLVDETKDDKQLALNVLGLIKHARYRHDEARVLTGYENAIAAFTELTKSNPQFTPGLYNLALVLIDKGLKEHGEAAHGLFSQAHELAVKGIHIDETRDKANRGLAVGYATAGSALRYMARRDPAKYEEALRYFDRSIKADPIFLYAYLSQGSIYNCLAAPEKANDQYQLATELNPTAQTFTRVGALLRHADRHADAVPMFQRAAELKPTAYAYTYWGMAVRDAELPGDEARKLFEKAIAADPKIPNGYNQLGLMYLRKEKWAEAAEAFEEAIKAAPDWSNYHYNLGRAFRGARKFDQAMDAFKRASAIYQSHTSSYEQLRELQEELGKVTDDPARNVDEKPSTAVRPLRTISEGQSCTAATVSLSMLRAW